MTTQLKFSAYICLLYASEKIYVSTFPQKSKYELRRKRKNEISTLFIKLRLYAVSVGVSNASTQLRI